MTCCCHACDPSYSVSSANIIACNLRPWRILHASVSPDVQYGFYKIDIPWFSVQVRDTVREAGLVFQLNGSRLGLARVGRLGAALKLREGDYSGAAAELENALRAVRDGGASGGADEAEILWALAAAKRLRGDADEGREEARLAAEVGCCIFSAM